MHPLNRLAALNGRLTELARGKFVTDVLGGMGAPARNTPAAKVAADKLRLYRTKPLAREITAARTKLASSGRPFKGLRVVTRDDEHFAFPPRSKTHSRAIGNLEKASAQFGPGAFEVATNPNNEVLVRETRRVYGSYPLT
jgi:hypothetical protein